MNKRNNMLSMKGNRIMLISGNYAPEETGIGKYNGEMISWLGKKGNDCTVVTTYPYYPHWKIDQQFIRRSWWFGKDSNQSEDGNIHIYRCPHYVPAKPSGVKRLMSDFSFFISAFLQVISLLFAKKFDVIIVVVPAFQLGLLGLFYKAFRGGTVVYHVQDLQIDAARDLGIISNKSLLRLFLLVEKFILVKCDHVSTISEGMMNKLTQKSLRKVIYFPNWVDTMAFHPFEDKTSLKGKWKFDASEKLVLYSGAIGEKQGLDSLLRIAKRLQNTDVRFIICGSGPYKSKLQYLAKIEEISNITFLPLQTKENFNSFLNMADLHLVLQKPNADDLVMPSKLSTILSVGGLVLVTASPKTTLHSILTRNNMGMIATPGDEDDLYHKIIAGTGYKYPVMVSNARNYALKSLDINNVIAEFSKQIGLQSNDQRLRSKMEFQVDSGQHLQEASKLETILPD